MPGPLPARLRSSPGKVRQLALLLLQWTSLIEAVSLSGRDGRGRHSHPLSSLCLPSPPHVLKYRLCVIPFFAFRGQCQRAWAPFLLDYDSQRCLTSGHSLRRRRWQSLQAPFHAFSRAV